MQRNTACPLSPQKRTAGPAGPVGLQAGSQPQHLPPQVEIIFEQGGDAVPTDCAALEHHCPVRQSQCKVEMMVNNDYRNFLSKPVKNFEQFLSDGRRKSLERLIKQEHL